MRGRLVAGLLAAAVTARAGGPGSTGANGLKLSAAARPESMGGAFTGLADDLNALFWNPAGLALLHSAQVSVMHASYVADTGYEMLAAGLPLGPLGTVGAAASFLNYGSFPKVSGGTSGLLGSLAPADIFVVTGWGLALPPVFGLDRIRAGVNVKLTFQQLSYATQSGLAFTGGLLWDTPLEGLRAGTVVDNAGTLVNIGGLLPLAWQVGAAYSRQVVPDWKATATADTKVQVDTSFHGGLGLEVTAHNLVAVRGGWRGGGAEGGPTFGLGAGYPVVALNRELRLQLDYALAAHGLLGSAQRAQLTVGWGAAILKPMGPLAIAGDWEVARLNWTGPGPAYRVEVRPEAEAEWVQLTDRPQADVSYAATGLPPAKYRFRVSVADPARPAWRGASRESEWTVLPPPLPPLELRIVPDGLDNKLAWKAGAGPAYHVYAVAGGDPEPLQVTERPTPGTEYSLKGLPPGEYTFVVSSADPKRPGWKGPQSNETRLVLEPPKVEAGLEALKNVQKNLGKILFENDRDLINLESDAVLAVVADVLQRFPQFTVRVEGHTDNHGGRDHNRKLSQARAEAVVRYLVEKKGVDGSRLGAKGFGDARPISDNGTEEGRAENRRVEFIVNNL